MSRTSVTIRIQMMMANIHWKFTICTILNTHSCHLHKKLSETDAMIILIELRMG